MPIPNSITPITVVGTYVYSDGTPARGSISFRPTVTAAVDEAIFPIVTVTEQLDEDGSFSVVLVSTDDPDWINANPLYEVTERITGAANRKYWIEIPAFSPGGTLDLATVSPVDPPSGGGSGGGSTPGDLDSDLVAIANLVPVNNDFIQRKSGTWTNRTPAQVKADLALSKSDVGLSAVDNTSDASKPISTATQTALDSINTNTGAMFDDLSDDILALDGRVTDLENNPGGGGAVSSVNGQTGVVVLGKSDVGLGNVDNTSDASKPISSATSTALAGKSDTGHTHAYADITGKPSTFAPSAHTHAISEVTSLQTSLDAKAPTASPTFTGTVTGVTKAHVGLSNVDNTSDTAKPVSTAQQSALDLKAPLASPTFTGTVSGITKAMVGLGSVDNTADTAKPVSSAQQTALNAKIAGPASATDNAVARYDGTTGKLTQDSLVTISDAGTLVLPGQASPTYVAGGLAYDTTERTPVFFNQDSGLRLDVGRELWVSVRNDTGSTIPNGAAVYVSGVHASGIPQVALAQANAEATSIAIGVTTQAIANNTQGEVTTDGIVHSFDTSALSVGPVYLSATTPGALTSTKPSAPNLEFRIGVVLRSHASQGNLLVEPGVRRLGWGTANQVLGMNAGGNGQEYKTLTAGSGITVTHGTNAVTIAASGGGGSGPGLPNNIVPVSGKWFPFPPGRISSNRTMDVGRGFFNPLPIGAAGTIDQLAIEVVTAGAAGSVIRAVLFNADATTRVPTTSFRDLGTVDTTTTGVKSWTGLAQAVSANTLYYVAFIAQAVTVTVRAIGAYNPYVFDTTAFSGTGETSCVSMTGLTGAVANGTSFTASTAENGPRTSVRFS